MSVSGLWQGDDFPEERERKRLGWSRGLLTYSGRFRATLGAHKSPIDGRFIFITPNYETPLINADLWWADTGRFPRRNYTGNHNKNGNDHKSDLSSSKIAKNWAFWTLNFKVWNKTCNFDFFRKIFFNRRKELVE